MDRPDTVLMRLLFTKELKNTSPEGIKNKLSPPQASQTWMNKTVSKEKHQLLLKRQAKGNASL